jgi:hypothetical protein
VKYPQFNSTTKGNCLGLPALPLLGGSTAFPEMTSCREIRTTAAYLHSSAVARKDHDQGTKDFKNFHKKRQPKDSQRRNSLRAMNFYLVAMTSAHSLALKKGGKIHNTIM